VEISDHNVNFLVKFKQNPLHSGQEKCVLDTTYSDHRQSGAKEEQNPEKRFEPLIAMVTPPGDVDKPG